jgi:hypothetical protein
VSSALDHIEAQAQFDGPEHAVHLRVAEHNDRIYLDLADECWQAAEVSATGWHIVGSPPVHFIRTPGMLPFPLPERGGSVETLAPFLNLPGRDEFVLVVAWRWLHCETEGPTRYWRSPANRGPQRPSD